MKIIDMVNETTVKELLPPASQSAGAVNGSAVDVRDFQGIMAAVLDGNTGGTGTLDVKIQDSPDGSTGWNDVTGAAFTQITTTGGLQVIPIDTRAVKRYIRAVSTVVTGPQVRACLLYGQKQII